MSRGGFREGAGRKSTWASGAKFEDTKIIRVPIAIADKILELAHQVDAGQEFVNYSQYQQLSEENNKLKKQIDLLLQRNHQLLSKYSQYSFTEF